MYQRKIPVDKEWGIVIFMELMGGKWKPWLINHIHDGEHQPKQLQQGIPLAAKRVLTKQLGELEAAGLVYKKVYAEIPMRVEYFLTAVGESVYPIIQEMDKWGKAHQQLLDHSTVPDATK